MPTALQGTTWIPSRGLYLNSPAHVVPNDMESDGDDFVICNAPFFNLFPNLKYKTPTILNREE